MTDHDHDHDPAAGGPTPNAEPSLSSEPQGDAPPPPPSSAVPEPEPESEHQSTTSQALAEAAAEPIAQPIQPPVIATAASIARPNAPEQPQLPTQQPSASGQTHSQGHDLPFVTPLSYLRPRPTPAASGTRGTMAPKPPSPLDREQMQGLRAIREFLKVRTSYDVLPLSFRLIVLDNDLLIKKSLNILIQNAIVSAPLWDSKSSTFAGLLTATDFINVIQYYCQFPDEMAKLEHFRLSSLRDIEKAIGVSPIETVSVNPQRTVYEACRRMLKTRARRIPLVDVDDETGREMVVSVITQYRILKFIAVNNEHNTVMLKKPIKDLGLGTWHNLAKAKMDTPVLEVVETMVKHDISCVPIVDRHNTLLNVFEAVDVIPCIKGGVYDELSASIGDALCRRPDDSPGIYTCTPDDRLDSIFDMLRKSRVHRLIVVDDNNHLKAVISLSDILKYILLYGEENDTR